MPGHGADRDGIALDPDVVEVSQVVDIDEALGPGQPQLHHRQQAVAAGDEPGLGAVTIEQRQRVLDARGPLVLERRGCLHVVPLCCRFAAVPRGPLP
jgi:hypothetical protein